MPKDVSTGSGSGAVSNATSRFLKMVEDAKKSLGPARMIFGFDATASRQETWNAAIPMQVDLLALFSRLGEIPPLMRLTYFRGRDEFQTTSWSNDLNVLTQWMRSVDCVSGDTQIAKTLSDAVAQAAQGKIAAVLYVGDCMEESATTLYSYARQLAELKVPVYLFQEGNDRNAFRTFAEIARLTGGRHVEFKTGNFKEMSDMAKVVIAQASGNPRAIAAVRDDKSLTAGAKALMLSFMPK